MLVEDSIIVLIKTIISLITIIRHTLYRHISAIILLFVVCAFCADSTCKHVFIRSLTKLLNYDYKKRDSFSILQLLIIHIIRFAFSGIGMIKYITFFTGSYWRFFRYSSYPIIICYSLYVAFIFC